MIDYVCGICGGVHRDEDTATVCPSCRSDGWGPDDVPDWATAGRGKR